MTLTRVTEGRYMAILGPNTNQWWVYDDVRDVYIDPPKSVLDQLAKLDIAEREARLMEVIKAEPEWLNEEDHHYDDIEI